MSSSLTFTGVGLALQSITVLNLGQIVRVRFTTDPKQADPNSSTDALHVANYNIAGPGLATVSVCTTVSGDPQSIDLNLASPLVSGSWTLTVANITTALSSPLVPPTSMVFAVGELGASADIAPGSENDDSEKLLRKFLNPALKGKNWDAVIAAVATGDTANVNNAKSAFDQIFKTSSSGIYLDRLAGNDGVKRPKNVGMSDDNFRKFAIKTTANKVTQEALLEILEVFYGTDAVRAHAITELGQPYSLSDGDDLNITIDGKLKVKVVFKSDDFYQISLAKASEVAAVITRAFKIAGSSAWAEAFVDPPDGLTKIKIYSGSLGLKGTVQIRGSGGGKAQNALRFNTSLSADVYSGVQIPDASPEGGNEVTLGTAPVLGTPTITIPTKEPHAYFPQVSDAGRIIVAGGVGNISNTDGIAFTPTTAEMYESDGRKSDLPDFPGYVGGQQPAVALGDGRILFCTDDFVTGNTSVETLDPVAKTWTTQAVPAGLNFSKTAAVTLDNGNALFIGLMDSYPTPGAKVVEYDMNTDTWINRADMPQNLSLHQAIVLDDGRVLVTGGFDEINAYLSGAYIYDPSLDAWTSSVNSMNEGRLYFGMCKLGNGKILIAGGNNGTDIDKVYYFNPATDTFIAKGDLDSPKGYFKLINLTSNYVVGFHGQFAYVYNPNLDVWVVEPTSTVIPWAEGFNVYYAGGDSLVRIGGQLFQDGVRSGGVAVEWYNYPGVQANYPEAPGSPLSWTYQDVISQSRCDMAFETVPDGRHILIGGQDATDEAGFAANWYDTVDYVSADGTTTGTLSVAPYAAAHIKSVLLDDGTIFIAGGATDATTGTNQTAIYDPDTDTWTSKANLHSALRDHALVKLANGKVLVIGGRLNDGSATAVCQMYDPALNTWTATDSLTEARFGHAAIRCSEGVLVVAGFDGAASPVGSAEINKHPEQPLSTWEYPAVYGSADVYVGFRPKIFLTADEKVIVCGGMSDLPTEAPSDINTLIFIIYPVSENAFGFFTSGNVPSLVYPRSGHHILPMPYTRVTNDPPYDTAWNGTPAATPVGYFPIILAGDTSTFSSEVIDPIQLIRYQRQVAYNGGSGLEKGFAAFVSSDGKILMVGGYNGSFDGYSHNEIWKSDE